MGNSKLFDRSKSGCSEAARNRFARDGSRAVCLFGNSTPQGKGRCSMVINQHGQGNRATIKLPKSSHPSEVNQYGSGNRIEIDFSRKSAKQLTRFVKPTVGALSKFTGAVWRLLLLASVNEYVGEAIGVAMSTMG